MCTFTCLCVGQILTCCLLQLLSVLFWFLFVCFLRESLIEPGAHWLARPANHHASWDLPVSALTVLGDTCPLLSLALRPMLKIWTQSLCLGCELFTGWGISPALEANSSWLCSTVFGCNYKMNPQTLQLARREDYKDRTSTMHCGTLY